MTSGGEWYKLCFIPMDSAKDIFSYRPYWAKRLTPAPFLPMSLEEMELLGWDSCDVILVTGDAYVDHPSFGMAVIGRVLEAQGFRVGIISQPDWQNADAFRALGRPNLFWGVTAGNMDSMVNRYTADRRIRSDDAYTPGGIGGKRPDRSVIVYAQRAREAYPDVPLIIGGIEASLRRIAHYDYWAEKVRRCVLLDAKADLLVYGNAERAIVEIAHRLAARKPIESITDLRGTAFVRKGVPEGWTEIDSTTMDVPGGRVIRPVNPYEKTPGVESEALVQPVTFGAPKPPLDRDRCVVRLPAYEVVVDHREMYAHDPAKPVNHSPNNTGIKELPPTQPAFIWYPGGASTRFPAVNGGGGRTAMAGPVYYYDEKLKSPGKLPKEYDRTLFIYEWSRNWIVAVHLDADNNIAKDANGKPRMERFCPNMTFKRPMDLELGADGCLYVAEFGTAWGNNKDTQIVRIEHIGGAEHAAK